MTMIDRYGVTGTSFAPTMLSMLLQHPQIDDFSLASRCGRSSYGGSSMPVETLRRAMARFPGADFVQGFGMTELSGNVLYFDPASHRLAATERPELLAAAGRTMALSRIRLVDDDMRDVAVGEVGEIVVQRRPGDARLLAAAGGQRGGVRRRVVPHRRHGPRRRRGLHGDRRPQEGHDRHRRRERVQQGGRGRHLRRPRRRRGVDHRAPRPALGRERHGRRRRGRRARR